MAIVLTLCGTIIVLVVAQDVFFTVLFPASGHGLLRKPLARWIWHLFRLIGKAAEGQKRRDILSYSGPTVITVTLGTWILLLVVGWGMIFKPALGTAIRAPSGPTDTGWITAFYFSGFNLTTLGVGDLAASTGGYRLLSICEAALGFAFFSMVITYFLSVYSSLTSRNAFAQGMHHRTGCTDNAAELLARMADGEDLPDAREHLSSTAGFLRQIFQTHRFYPVLRHFHYREHYYALPRVLLTALDTATLVHTALDEERYSRIIQSPALDELFEAAMALMHELVPEVKAGAPSAEEAERWRSQYEAAVARLAEAGLQVRDDREGGLDAYLSRRAEWDRPVRELAETMLYDWDSLERAPDL